MIFRKFQTYTGACLLHYCLPLKKGSTRKSQSDSLVLQYWTLLSTSKKPGSTRKSQSDSLVLQYWTMLNSSRKPGPLEKLTLTSLSYVKFYPQNPFFGPLEKYDHTSMIGYNLFKKMLSRTNGGCYIKPLCSHAYFFSRNRRPYRGVNLPGFLGETRKMIYIT